MHHQPRTRTQQHVPYSWAIPDNTDTLYWQQLVHDPVRKPLRLIPAPERPVPPPGRFSPPDAADRERQRRLDEEWAAWQRALYLAPGARACAEDEEEHAALSAARGREQRWKRWTRIVLGIDRLVRQIKEATWSTAARAGRSLVEMAGSAMDLASSSRPGPRLRPRPLVWILVSAGVGMVLFQVARGRPEEEEVCHFYVLTPRFVSYSIYQAGTGRREA